MREYDIGFLGGGQLARMSIQAAQRMGLRCLVLDPDTDAENEARVRERRSWPIERLLAEFERDGEEMQDLLSKLTDEHRELRLGGRELTLGKLMRIVEHERHDLLHLRQLRAAVRDNGA